MNDCLDKGRNAIPPIRMFKQLLLKAIHNVSDAVVTTGEKRMEIYLQVLLEKSQRTGMENETVIGDTAYSGQEPKDYFQLRHN